jgi:hypothetical protein
MQDFKKKYNPTTTELMGVSIKSEYVKKGEIQDDSIAIRLPSGQAIIMASSSGNEIILSYRKADELYNKIGFALQEIDFARDAHEESSRDSLCSSNMARPGGEF